MRSSMKIPTTIKPNSRHREEVVVGSDGTYIIYTKAPAIEGRANAAAIKLLAKHFGVSKSQVRLLRGATSKHKVFNIDNAVQ
jgi:UPF0235 protein mflv_3569